MNSELFWSAISGISGILALMLTIFIEWPKIKVRLNESQSAIQKFVLGIVAILSFLGVVLFGLSMFSLKDGYLRGNLLLEQGRIGLSLVFASLGIVFFNDFFSDSRSKPNILKWLYFVLGTGQIAISAHFLVLAIQS